MRLLIESAQMQPCNPYRGILGCVFSWFYFLWHVNLGEWRFCVTQVGLVELLELTDIFDFGTQVLRMLRVAYQEWLRYVTYNEEPWLNLLWLCFLQTLFVSSVRTGHEKEYLTNLFLWVGKWNFYIVRKPCQRPPCMTFC